MAARSNNVTPKLSNVDFKPLRLTPSLEIFSDTSDILLNAKARTPSTIARAATTPTAFQSFPTSTKVNAITEPTRIARAIAISFNALALILKATDRSTLAKPLRTFCMFLVDFFIISLAVEIIPATLENILPRPANGAAIASIALANFIKVASNPTVTPAANSLSHGMAPKNSITFLPRSLRNFHILTRASLIPLINPRIKLTPMLYDFVEGE